MNSLQSPLKYSTPIYLRFAANNGIYPLTSACKKIVSGYPMFDLILDILSSSIIAWLLVRPMCLFRVSCHSMRLSSTTTTTSSSYECFSMYTPGRKEQQQWAEPEQQDNHKKEEACTTIEKITTMMMIPMQKRSHHQR